MNLRQILILIAAWPLALLTSAAKTEKLDYLPRPVVGLPRPIVWGPGLKVLIVGGGPSPYHDHQVCNRDIDGNTLHGIKASTLYTERLADLPLALQDADVLLCCAAPEKSQIDDASRQAVLDFIARGKGVVFCHEMLWVTAWKNWPDKFRRLTGRAAADHVYQAPFSVTVTNREHPVMKGIPAIFSINDELYRSKPVPDGAPTEVLATAQDEKGETWPMVWTVDGSPARIVCLPLGHNEDVHHDEVYRRLLVNAVRWVSGGPAESTGWTALFNGRDLSGWLYQCRPADRPLAAFTVDHGSIWAHLTAGEKHDNCWLTTERVYGDFDLRLKFQSVRGDLGNSGVQIRCLYDESLFEMEGPQLDIHPRAPWRTGMLYDETRGTNRFLCPAGTPQQMSAKLAAPNFRFYFASEGPGWNTMEIRAQGSHIVCTLNDVVVSDFHDTTGILTDAAHQKYQVGVKGHIALQLHADFPLDMRFKDIEIRDLGLK
jgi:type 1 glutamine amidotransferase